jgi:uridine monophosphate synthetase
MKDWADIIDVHVISGKGVLEAFQTEMRAESGVLIVAEMSSEGNFLGADYSKKALDLARDFSSIVCGLIAQKCLDKSDPTLLTMTPGVSLDPPSSTKGKDGLGQTYRDVETVLGEENLSDVIIVGRAILKAKDPAQAAKEAQERAWNAYLKRLNFLQ